MKIDEGLVTDTMVLFSLRFYKWVFLLVSLFFVVDSSSWCPHHMTQQTKPIFEKKTDRFWKFEEQSNSWVEVNLPFDLVSCVNGNCTKVGSIDKTTKNKEDSSEEGSIVLGLGENLKSEFGNRAVTEENFQKFLRWRKRISLTRMSETSIWVTGESGSIYERFWNGVHWVIAPHDLPPSAGPAIAVLIINQTILALSEAGNLYQLQLSENSQPVWIEFIPTFEPSTNNKEMEAIQIKAGVVSYNRERVYFSTINGSLLELSEVEPPRWINHGRPAGGNVAAIADAASIRPDVVFTMSSTGDLYEFDRSSKPSWKKHIWSDGSMQDILLMPSKGCTLHGLAGPMSSSLFVLAKDGYLVERRLNQRKWKWIIHGGPKDHHLTSITPVVQDELNDKILSLFLTTATGSVFEYRVPKHSGVGASHGNQMQETWVDHMHPLHAFAAMGIPGLQFQIGRIMFPLDDGRLAELHFPGIGGEDSGPIHSINARRKTSIKYEWSVLDAPETEGWNTEYCNEERGPLNCITGMRDEPNDLGITRPTTRRRKGGQEHQSYLVPSTLASSPDKSWDQNLLANVINNNFHMRVMQTGKSLFLITDDGFTFEYLYAENVWLWLRHEHSTTMKGVVGNYNGSLFLVDTLGNLLIRERSGDELAWINCTAMRKGRQIIGGPPWDGIPGKARRVTMDDALFFVGKNGRLLQFTVSFRKFKWKDCLNPPNTKIASIVDQETFRENIVFVIGRNGRLYQYNKVTELWHEHYQSPHLILSRLPGTAMKLSLSSLMGSMFMVAEEGGLVEYQWDTLDGWNWVEHGTPNKSVTLVGAPGPCLDGNQLFVIGSDGIVYLRYYDQRTWKWQSYGFPSMENMGAEYIDNKICVGEDIMHCFEKNEQNLDEINRNCDAKVALIRPIPFSEDAVMFELRDCRLAELRRVDDKHWAWSRTISTPTSLCIANYRTALAA